MDSSAILRIFERYLHDFDVDSTILSYVADVFEEMTTSISGETVADTLKTLLESYSDLDLEIIETERFTLAVQHIADAIIRKGSIPNCEAARDRASNGVSLSKVIETVEIGCHCRALFTDGLWHPAIVTEIIRCTSDNSCRYAVKFTNFESDMVLGPDEIDVVTTKKLAKPVQVDTGEISAELKALLNPLFAQNGVEKDVREINAAERKALGIGGDVVYNNENSETSHILSEDEEESIDSCEMCDRRMPLTRHHLIPQKLHKRYTKILGCSRQDLQIRCALICRPCHSGLHSLYDHSTLAESYNTVEKILEDPSCQRFISYFRKQKVTSHSDSVNPNCRYKR
eukprot:228698_1